MNRPVNVLIVEDLPLAVALVRTSLEAEGGITSEFVHTLDDAIKRLPAGRVDVVLLDLGLPDADGVRAVEALMAAHPEVPIVVLSGRREEYAAALEAGAQEFLAKPASGPAVAQALRDAVVRHQVRKTFEPIKQLRQAADEVAGLIRELKKVKTDLKADLGREPGSGARE